MEIETILFDMDGVLVDFERGFELTTGESIYDFDKSCPHWLEDFLDAELPNGFFRQLKSTPDFYDLKFLMEELSEMGYNVGILSTCTDSHYDEIRLQKKAWLNDHDLSRFKWNFVRDNDDKVRYSNSTTLIIDDFGYIVNMIEESGGSAIKYEGCDSLTRELKHLEIL